MLFSIISAVNCVAEVFVYFVSSTFIRRIGHIRVLYTALVCYSLRLFYYGLLTNPWYVLAAEPLSGITTAAAWASMTSFVGLNANLESVTTLQGILQSCLSYKSEIIRNVVLINLFKLNFKYYRI